MSYRTPLLTLLAFALSGCVTIPDNLQGEYAQEPLPNSVSEQPRDQAVRWGGLLLDTRAGEDGTCMLLLARPLDRWYRPRAGGESGGEFIACHDEVLDPDVFLPGREVTVVGVLDGFGEGYKGEDLQLFPMVRTRSAHAWSASTRVRELEHWDHNTNSAAGRSTNRLADRVAGRPTNR